MKQIVHYVPHTHFDAEVFLTREVTLEIGYSHMLGALAAMKADARFKFAIDQTCYIEPFLNAYPEERAAFEALIAEGRLEVTCGMHAMPDVNIPSGESFIRQVLSGKEYIRRELGVDTDCGWLLDSFGQHPQIPQLMRGCGFEHNIFQRIGTIDGPTEYWWQGLDGTKLFCHWMRGSYCALYSIPNNLHEFESLVRDRLHALRAHTVHGHILALSGADLTAVQPHATEIFDQFNAAHDDLEIRVSTPKEYFDTVRGLAEYPIFQGDLNPVFQGCYSARIKIKQWNRKMETLLHDVEWLGSISGRETLPDELKLIWEDVLFNQFHDIICGSQVDVVYERVLDRYSRAHAGAARLKADILADITARIDTTGDGVPLVVFNSLSWSRTDYVECDLGFSDMDVYEIEVGASNGTLVPSDLIKCERYPGGGIKKATIGFVAKDVPSMGYEVYHAVPATRTAPATDVATNQPAMWMSDIHSDVIENSFVRIEIDAWSGAVRSLKHKATDWELVPADQQFFGTVVKTRDSGNFWEYNGHCKGDAFLSSLRLHPLPDVGEAGSDFSHLYGGDGRVRCGKARVEFNVHFAYGKGYYASRIRLYAGVPRVDIKTTLVNQDERVRYRAAFPVTISDGTITHEIPFGAIDRPPGELPAQNWMDYSDGSRGVTVLNRGNPGNDVEQGVMMLALLKCTALKEGYGEVGGFSKSTKTTDGYEIDVHHEFDYAVVPHSGDWKESRAYRSGLEFNQPLIVAKASAHSGDLPNRRSVLTVDAPNVVISSVRDTTAGSAVRLYEAQGTSVEQVRLASDRKIVSAAKTNLIGDNPEPVPVGLDGSLQLSLGAYEIVTLCLVFEAS